MTIAEIREIIAKNTKKIGHYPYSETRKYGTWNEFYGYGLIDACSVIKNTPF